MKRILLAAGWCLVCSAAHAQVPGEEPYHGGAADGYSAVGQINFTGASLAFSPYLGGAGDGYDGDDAATNTALPFANNFSPFIGGAGDGYDIEDAPGNMILSQAVAFGPFLGGVADGYAGLLIPNVTVLPLGLLTFEGRAAGAANLLFWKTQKEDGLAHFGLERSADGRTFVPLAQLKAMGNGGGTDYDFTDGQSLTGRNYYRLKLQDADGSHTYSNVVLLIRESDAGPSLVLFPNPARQSLRLQHERLPDGTVGRVIDARGSVIWQASITSGSHTVDLPVDRWTPGTYLLHLAAPNGWGKEVRFVKQ
jgi:hypothetical protein